MSRAKPLRLADYLGHMLQAAERCHEHVGDMDEADFRADSKTQDAVIRTLEIIGEAANSIRKSHPDFVAEHPEIPFSQAIGMRNVLSHGYFLVDLPAVWAAIQADLPPLRLLLRAALDSLPSP